MQPLQPRCSGQMLVLCRSLEELVLVSPVVHCCMNMLESVAVVVCLIPGWCLMYASSSMKPLQPCPTPPHLLLPRHRIDGIIQFLQLAASLFPPTPASVCHPPFAGPPHPTQQCMHALHALQVCSTALPAAGHTTQLSSGLAPPGGLLRLRRHRRHRSPAPGAADGGVLRAAPARPRRLPQRATGRAVRRACDKLHSTASRCRQSDRARTRDVLRPVARSGAPPISCRHPPGTHLLQPSLRGPPELVPQASADFVSSFTIT